MQQQLPWIKTASDEDRAKVQSPSTRMAVALGWTKRPGEVYGGTVAHAEKTRRRAVGKRQRAGRRIARKAAHR